VILPTFNEKTNLEKLLPNLFKVFKENNLDADVLIIDDNSSDGTGTFAEDMKKKKYPVKVIHRKNKLGIGSAYLSGFRKSLDDNIDIIFEMDADLSHKPEYITDFIKKIQDGYDMIIGEREKIIGWGLYRKTVSKVGNFIGRNIAGIKINDLTTGYRAYKKEVVASINLDKIKSEGYEFQLETLYIVIKKGFNVGSIPITFFERKNGKSKLSKKDIINFLLLSLKIRLGLIDV
jgi:dolichol-phosphate mannosyltransferase